jgi:glycosyltransferase involved in cell wall biosynthesis
MGHFGHKAKTLEIEDFLPDFLCRFLRKYLLNMHLAHLPLFPLFFSYDTVVTSTAYSSLFLKACLNKMKIPTFKWVLVDFNVVGTLGSLKTLKQKIFYFSIKNGADAIVTISLAEKDAMEKLFPNLRGRVFFSHEATDLDFFKPINKDKIKNPPMILSVGNFGRDFKTLVDACIDLPVNIVLACKPSLVKGLNLPKNVIHGLFDAESLRDLYEEASLVYLAPKVKEGDLDSVGTLALGEAMAMGKCIISAHTISFESYIRDCGIGHMETNGIFIHQGDASILKTNIQRLILDTGARKQMGKNAYNFALKYLDQKHFSEKIHEALVSIHKL